MKIFKKQINKTQEGFTLVETLVAISIFTVSVLAMISVLSDGIADTNYAKKKVTSVYLAQEGIETIRNMRDTYMLFSLPASKWTDFVNKTSACTGGAGANGCYFDDWNLDYNNPTQPITNIPLTACGANCPTLLYDSSTGRYNYFTGVNSGFIRKIKVRNIDANSMEVTVTIFWTQQSGTYQLALEEHLINWTE